MEHDNEPAPDRRWRSGEFVIECRRRRLLRAGVPVAVEERAFDLVALLAANHERALDRREVIAALWGARPVSETTLRQVLHKARRALGDDGRRQAVIRTLHGRSLRWVAPIEALADVAASRGDAARSAPASRRTAPSAALALLVLACLVVALAAVATSGRAGRSGGRVAVAPIENATGDHALDWTSAGLAGLLAYALERGGVEVADGFSVAGAAAQPVRDEHSLARQLRAATGADVVILGRLSRRDRGYELDLRVQAPRRAIEEIRVTGDLPGELAVDSVPRVRRALGRDAPHA